MYFYICGIYKVQFENFCPLLPVSILNTYIVKGEQDSTKAYGPLHSFAKDIISILLLKSY